MAKRHTTADFIKKAIAIHGDRYCYSATNYMGADRKLNINCNEHGVFSQIPYNHLRGSGCPDCAGVKKIGLDGFIAKARKIHGDKYCYKNVVYKTVSGHVKLYCKPCDNHFSQTVTSHLKGASCPKCRSKPSVTTADFIRRSIEINGDKYTYENTIYTRAAEKIIITCKLHGDFLQQANSHLQGTQCPKCAKELQGWRRSDYLNTCRAYNGLSNLYVLKCYGENEVFYKIGITCSSISKRFRSASIPYDYDVVYKVVGEAGFIWDLELSLHRANKRNQYKPKTSFDGYTECFSEIDKDSEILLDRLSGTTQLQLIA